MEVMEQSSSGVNERQKRFTGSPSPQDQVVYEQPSERLRRICCTYLRLSF